MKTIRLTYPLSIPNEQAKWDESIVLAIGDFDGVHFGHRKVIETAVHIAKKERLQAAVMTFDPHPREVLSHLTHFRYLTPIKRKLQLFEEIGVQIALVMQFDQSFANISPEAFVDQVLKQLSVHTVVVGFDFTFGNEAKGTVETLRELCEGHMDVEVVKPMQLHGEKISSTLIREHLQLGDLDRVKQLLGRNYSVSGVVVHGEGRGRTIGFPTANVALDDRYIIPKTGVYAVRFHVDEEIYDAVMNIGYKPTFEGHKEEEPTLEVHVIDYNGNLYDKNVQIEFLEYIRSERKFPNVEALIDQISKDVATARDIASANL